jgi:hypothetical protein
MYAKLYVWTYLCKNLSIAKLSTPYFSLYAWSSFSPILFSWRNCLQYFLFFLHQTFCTKLNKLGGVCGKFCKLTDGPHSHYKNTIQFICQFFWATGKNAQNVLLKFKFALLGINVTLRNWLVGVWVLKTPYLYWVVLNVDNLGS